MVRKTAVLMTTCDDIGLAILTWKAPKTLRACLESHQKSGLFSLISDRVLLFNQGTAEEVNAVADFDIPAVLETSNLGIHRGAWAAASQTSSEYLLFLENDISCIETHETLKTILENARSELQTGADVVMLRSRRYPGPDFVGIEKYMKFNPVQQLQPSDSDNQQVGKVHRLARILRPHKRKEHLSAAPYVEQHPENIHSEITRSPLGNFRMSSRYAPWTNQPHLIRRSLFLELMEYVNQHPSPRQTPEMQTIETALRKSGWHDRDYVTCVHSRGCFRHSRIDR